MAGIPKNFKVLIGLVLSLFCCAVLVISLLFTGSIPPKKETPALVFPTRQVNPSPTPQAADSSMPAPTALPSQQAQAVPVGKIVFVCQIFKAQAQDQLCIINADGTGWRRLTQDDNVRSFYPSLTPDGNSVVFSSNLDGNFKLYEMRLDGQITALGDTIGFAPEVSPDNKRVVFANSNGQAQMIWLMERDGSQQRLLYKDAWDPTWAPDGERVLFATTIDNKPQLASIKIDGTGFQQLTDLPYLRGRSDWSADGSHIVTYSGQAWQRELYMLNSDGSDTHQITVSGGNSQGPTFSPDGQWVAFTAYYDSIGNNNGCEIYIMQINGDNLKRLTTNSYCDWQPRWGP